jgi:hypothetical protein
MPRKAWVLLALAALWAPNHLAAGEFFSKIKRDFRRNNCWPQPFIIPDRIAARAPFEVMIRNGWQVQNTLSDEHFNPETGELIGAGELKVRGILVDSPPSHRDVFILRGKTPEDTANRQRSVEAYAARLLQHGENPQITQTLVRPRGTPAERIVDIDARYSASTPEPRLAPSSGGSSSSGSGSGN